MLKKLSALFCVAALSFAFVGCDSGTIDKATDQAKEGVDSATDAAKDAADGMVPDAAKDTVDGAVDGAGEKAKEGIDAAGDAAKGEG